MTRLRVLVARIREFFLSARVDRELSEELQGHFDFLVEEHLRRALTLDEARAAARRELGGLEQTKELVRDHRGIGVLEGLLRELRYAVRLLRKAPGFTAVAVLTLALGIGVNAAIFSVVDAVVLRPLPYPEADRLVSIWETVPEEARQLAPAPRGAVASRSRIVVAPANFVDYRHRATSFGGMATWASTAGNLTGSGNPERLTGEEVSWEYFDVLRVRPALGRSLRAADDVDGAPAVVVISDGLWRQRFAADPQIVGRSVTLDGHRAEIVGVMPPRFRSLSSFASTDPVSFWTPAAYPAELLSNHDDHEVNVVARMRPGVRVEAARAEMAALSESLARERPDAYARARTDLSLLVEDVIRGVRTSMLVLLGAVGVVLLMASVNVANLLIIRAVGRRREIAVRFALGASRARVMAQLVAQSLVLAMLGCAAGLVLAIWTKRLLLSVAPATIPRLDTVSIDGRILAVTAVVSLVTGVLFGLLPAWQVRRARPIEAMTGERLSASAGVLRWRSALMVAEVALSTVLLIGAGLMSRSLATLNAVDLGFAPGRVLALKVPLPAERYRTADDRLAFFEELERRVAVLPGVRSVAFANQLPLRGGWDSGVVVEPVSGPAAPDAFVIAGFQAVSPDYFATLGIPLRRGRALTAADRKDSLPVAVVTEEFARRYLGRGDPLGRRFRRSPQAPWITVVGVAADVRREGKAAPIDPQVYLPAAQTTLYPVRLSDLAVRADVEPYGLVPAIRSCVWALDKEQPVTGVRTLEDTLTNLSAERRFETLLFGLFALLAVALAVVGIYGVVAYAVSQRTSEIGIRMALGAGRAAIVAWTVAGTAWLIVVGAAAGLVAAFGVSRYLRSLLFEITPTDPSTYATATLALAVVGLGASWLAGRRAASVDPLAALRRE